VHPLDLMLTLICGLVAALMGGSLTQRLKLTPIVGYVLAGLVVGRYVPGLPVDRLMAEQLAAIGAIFLMFDVGMRLRIQDLLAAQRVAVPGAIAQSLVATTLCAVVADVAGWGLGAGVVYGLALSVASTTVLVRVLADHRQLDTPTGHIAVGWLAVEHLFTVLVLVLLPATVAANTDTTVTDAFGGSMAVGAFLAGLVVGRLPSGVRAAADALRMREAFALLFFLSVGMLLDPGTLLDDPMMLAATLAVVLIGKPLTILAMLVLFRYPFAVGLSVAIALAQIGELSVIVATVANDLGALTADATNTLVAAVVFSITLNPLLFRSMGWIERRTAPDTARGRRTVTEDPR
jgi:CPA2 family monovalent cation:H+ antiporter-2